MLDYNIDYLKYLRNHTKISRRQERIFRDKEYEIDEIYKKISRIEHTNLPSNYSSIYKEEFNIRYLKHLKKIAKDCKRQGDGLTEEEFCNKDIIEGTEREKSLKLI